MIKTEIRGNFTYTYSNLGVKIHGGVPESDYDEAYDPNDSNRTYVETDIPIESDATEADYQNALGDLGVNFNEEE